MASGCGGCGRWNWISGCGRRSRWRGWKLRGDCEVADPGFFIVTGWDEYQHYKNRNPPWIKLHFALLASESWVLLDDASRVLAIACMLLASRNEGKIPNNPLYVQRVAYLNTLPDFKPLIDCGFLSDPDNLLATCLQDASKVLAQSREEKSREEKSRGANTETDGSNGKTRRASTKTKANSKNRGTRFTGTELPIEWRTWTTENAPAIDASEEFQKFKDHWKAQPGSKGVRADWPATWRNWIRNAKAWNKNGSGSSKQTGPAQAHKDFPDD